MSSHSVHTQHSAHGTNCPAVACKAHQRTGRAGSAVFARSIDMKILVLGSGAGGGYPQWNCNCELCGGLRRGSTQATPRTQSSIAVSADGERWLLLNASPD